MNILVYHIRKLELQSAQSTLNIPTQYWVDGHAIWPSKAKGDVRIRVIVG